MKQYSYKTLYPLYRVLWTISDVLFKAWMWSLDHKRFRLLRRPLYAIYSRARNLPYMVEAKLDADSWLRLRLINNFGWTPPYFYVGLSEDEPR